MSLWKYLGPIGALGTAITGNQAKQKRKGAIGEAYRVNAAQQELDQAATRQDTNEELNARGVLTAGGTQGVPPQSLIAKAVASGGKQFGSLDRFEEPASKGSVGPANTLSGGVNSALTDQFALERKDLATQKSNAEKANRADYLGSIGHALEEGIDTTANLFGANLQTEQQGPSQSAIAAGNAAQASAGAVNDRIQGAYGMPTIPDFSAPAPAMPKTSFGTSDTPNYSFGSS